MSNFGQYNINAIFASEQDDYASLNESAHTDALERFQSSYTLQSKEQLSC